MLAPKEQEQKAKEEKAKEQVELYIEMKYHIHHEL
jgi:hypothetical protein